MKRFTRPLTQVQGTRSGFSANPTARRRSPNHLARFDAPLRISPSTMDRQTLGILLTLLTTIAYLGYLATAARRATARLTRRQDQLATAAATLALLLSFGLM